jgi:hypothetical protein
MHVRILPFSLFLVVPQGLNEALAAAAAAAANAPGMANGGDGSVKAEGDPSSAAIGGEGMDGGNVAGGEQ